VTEHAAALTPRSRRMKGGSLWRSRSHAVGDSDLGRHHLRSVAEPRAGWVARCGGGGAAASPVGGLLATVVVAPRVRGGSCQREWRRPMIDEIGAAGWDGGATVEVDGELR
jgi:hypothetical protein